MASDKLFLSANSLQEKSWELLEQIVNAGFLPDYLIAVWRGGSVIGLYLHEVFKVLGIKMDHYPVKATSYSGIGERNDVVLEGVEHVLNRIKDNNYKKVLLVDDVFETGNTLHKIKNLLRGVDVRIATPYWKEDANQTTTVPDFFVEKLCKEIWIVFPHEFEGLSDDEIRNKGSIYPRLKTMRAIIQL